MNFILSRLFQYLLNMLNNFFNIDTKYTTFRLFTFIIITFAFLISLLKTKKSTDNEKIQKIDNALKYFEFKGIKKFYDISTILDKPKLFNYTIDLLENRIKRNNITKILAIDARGFIFGAPLAIKMGIPLIMVRKKGKLPEQNIISSKPYTKEYNEIDVLCIPKNSIENDDNVLIIDDLIATGGTLNSAIELVKMCEANKIICGSIVELKELNGRENLNKAGNKDVEIFGLIDEKILN